MDCSPPGSSVHGISQKRILEGVAISFSEGYSGPRDQPRVSCTAGGFFTTEPPGNPAKTPWSTFRPQSTHFFRPAPVDWDPHQLVLPFIRRERVPAHSKTVCRHLVNFQVLLGRNFLCKPRRGILLGNWEGKRPVTQAARRGPQVEKALANPVFQESTQKRGKQSQSVRVGWGFCLQSSLTV